MPHFSKRHDRRPRYGGKPAGRKSRPGSAQHSADGTAEGVRLQKVLAAAGVGSRRQCEEMIREGRVDVDGKVITELGTRVDPARQKIRVDGETLRRPKLVYYAINKPNGILATNRDPSGRPRVIDLAPHHKRLYSVGRLDKSSEGLILVTNDGELTDLLTHPRYGVEKTYLAQVVGVPTPEDLARLRRGVHFAEGFAQAKQVRVRRTHKQSAVLEIVLDEGRNREVRRLLARIGHKVLRLQRVAIGPLRLANLLPGEHRMLGRDEVEELYRAAREGRKRKPHAVRTAPTVGKPVRSAAEPIIDHSLSLESDAEVENWPTAEITGESAPTTGVDASGDPELAGFEMDDEEFPAFVPVEEADEEVGKVNLAPIVPGQRRSSQEGTVIGGDQRRQSGKPGGARQRRSRKNQRPKNKVRENRTRGNQGRGKQGRQENAGRNDSQGGGGRRNRRRSR